jgi:hypothetical protein
VKFPVLFDICQDKDCMVEYLEGHNYNLAFRRNLHGDNLSNWNSMVQDIFEIPRNEDSDVVF